MSYNTQHTPIDSENIEFDSIFLNNIKTKDMPQNFPEAWYETWDYIDQRSWKKIGKLLLSIAFQHNFLNEIDQSRLINSYWDVFQDACPPSVYTKYKHQFTKILD